jgi:membrane-bound serine protease (ClpP class)
VFIRGSLDRGVVPYVQRVLQEADKDDVVILEIDTLGGFSEPALQIRDAIMTTEATTIAFINPRAISAGALISMAANHIVMKPGGTIGAAAPIEPSGTEASAVTEKNLSYFRSEMRATAESRGRRTDIAEAMVDPEIEIEGITKKGDLLTLTTGEALEYGLAEYEAMTFSNVLEHYDLAQADVVETQINWAEQMVRFLTSPLVSLLLMLFGFVGLFIELRTPGFGVPGTVGIICLSLFFWGHFLVQLVGWEEMILFIAGVVLLLIEIFVIPGFGVVGILGIFGILTSLVLTLVGRVELLTFQDVRGAITQVTAALIGSIIVAIVLAKFLPRTTIGKQIILYTTQKHDAGYVSQTVDYSNIVGKIGITITPVHPSGTMMLSGKRYDVVSEGGFIDKNVKVNVIEVEGMRIVVRPLEQTVEV